MVYTADGILLWNGTFVGWRHGDLFTEHNQPVYQEMLLCDSISSSLIKWCHHTAGFMMQVTPFKMCPSEGELKVDFEPIIASLIIVEVRNIKLHSLFRGVCISALLSKLCRLNAALLLGVVCSGQWFA